MVILSHTGLKQALDNGDIVVHPLTQSAISNNSIDIRLGKWYFPQNQSHGACPVFDLKTNDYQKMWGAACQAQEEIIIPPGEMILATSEEFIGARRKYTTMLKTKSSLARLGLDLCSSAGWGDVGYINRWAFPLTNRTPFALSLPVGTWIGQMVFMEISHPEEDGYAVAGQYQHSDDLQTVIDTWTVDSILPQKPLKFTPVK